MAFVKLVRPAAHVIVVHERDVARGTKNRRKKR